MKVVPGKDFGTRECPSCACEIPANHNRCPICQYEFPTPTSRQKGLKLWGALIMLGLMILLYVINYLT